MDVFLHHVSVVTTDLARAMAFYCDVLGMQPVERPPFIVAGAWLAAGSAQVHLIDHVDGTFRGKNIIDNNDVHFALRVPDFESVLKELAAKGYHEDLEENDPKRVLVRRTGLAGFPQAYLIDPDQHVVEINAVA